MRSKFDYLGKILNMPANPDGVGTLNGNRTDVNGIAQNVNADGARYDGERGTVTLQTLEEEGNGILDQNLDRQLTKIRPYDNPIDSISRLLPSAQDISSMEPESGSIGTIPLEDSVQTEATTLNTNGFATTIDIKVNNVNMWIKHDTFTTPRVPSASEQYTFYIYAVDFNAQTLKCILLNDNLASGFNLPADTKIQRLATAVNEREAMIDANEPLPDKNSNYCQFFMKTTSMGQIAQKHKMNVDFGFDDLREMDLWDFRRQIESAFLFGKKAKFVDIGNLNKTVYTCNGVWNQATANDFVMPKTIDDKTFVDITEKAFIGNNGSDTKIMLVGHGLASDLMKSVQYERYITQQNVQVVAGIEFHKIKTNHGTLLIKPHDLFIGDHYHDGIILDPNYLIKKYYQRTKTDKLDLLKAGKDRSDTIVISEISTICVKNLPAHMRIFGNQ